MTLIHDLLRMLQNKLAFLNSQKSNALQVGDVSEVERLDSEISEVNTIIEKLRD